MLPDYCKGVNTVIIGGRKADYNESLYIKETTVDLNRDVETLTNYLSDGKLISIDTTLDTEDNNYMSADMPIFYRVSNGWIHTNVEKGNIEITYKTPPVELDPILGIEFPLIPDEVHTKKALMAGILRNMIIRGYVHPVMNIKENNPFVNPALAYKEERVLARIAITSPNSDAREKYTKPHTSLFGKRKPVYIPDKTPLLVTDDYTYATRWVQDGQPYCEVVDGNNTGYLIVPMKQQNNIAGVWTDTIVTKEDRIQNLGVCPVLAYRAAYFVGDVYGVATAFDYTEVAPMIGHAAPTKTFNYLYLSVPSNKKFTTNTGQTFTKVNTESVPGYVKNDVYRSDNMFYTGVDYEFNIEVF
jgi:hypothetical protein